MRRLVALPHLLAVAAAVGPASPARSVPERPDIVPVLGDAPGFAEIGAYRGDPGWLPSGGD